MLEQNMIDDLRPNKIFKVLKNIWQNKRIVRYCSCPNTVANRHNNLSK